MQGSTNKGGRGKRDPNALRTIGVRLPLVRPEIARLLEVMATTRNTTKAELLQRLLITSATIEEAEQAGLVE